MQSSKSTITEYSFESSWLHKRNPHPLHPLSIPLPLLAEKFAQEPLFTPDPLPEEPQKNNNVTHGPKQITNGELRPNSPPEEPKVARVPYPNIQTMRN